VNPPKGGVERERDPAIYEGTRLLIKRGITSRGGANGQILARLETLPFCFRHSIYGVRLMGAAERERDILLGIIWSSLTRYFAWITAGSWGMWHDELLKETIERIPVRLPSDARLRQRIVKIVRELRLLDVSQLLLFQSDGPKAIAEAGQVVKLERELDNAIFDLFELTPAERELVRDMCDVGLPFFYKGNRSASVKPVPLSGQRLTGTRKDIPRRADKQTFMDAYNAAFLEVWEHALPADGHFRWRIIYPGLNASMLAIEFATEEKGHPLPADNVDDDEKWAQLLAGLGRTSRHNAGSTRIYLDGMTRIVRENEIIIIKQNERRLWTRTAAREDAEATLLKARRKQEGRALGVAL
jgi:hypothetical protein